MRTLIVAVLLSATEVLASPLSQPLPVEQVARNDTPFRQSLSHDGKWLAEDVSISSGRMQAHIRNLVSGQIISLGEPGKNVWAPVWSPDGTRLAYFQDDNGEAALWIRDQSGRARRIPDVSGVPLGAFSYGNAVAWLPDGQGVVTLITPQGQYTPRDGFPLRPVPFAKVGPDQAEVTIYGGDEPGANPPLPPKACGQFVGRCDLAVVDLRSGAVRRIATGLHGGHEEVAAIHLSLDGDFVAYFDQVEEDPGAYGRKYGSYLYELTACGIKTGHCKTMPEGGLAIDDMTTWHEKLSMPFPEIHWQKTLGVIGRRERDRVIDAAADPREEYALGSSQVLRWQPTESGSSAGSLLLPPGYKKGTRLPLVVWIYPNDKGSERGFRLKGAYDLQVLATRGYALLYPDAPTREGTPYEDVFDAVEAAVDAAVAQGYADPERLAIMGCSAGSDVTLSVLTKTKRFKAAEITCSVTHPDLVASYVFGPAHARQDQIGSYYERKGSSQIIGGSIWENADGYIANSPIYGFDRIETPILIGKGEVDADDRIASDAIFLALRRLGKPVEYRIYRSEGHVITRPANVIDFWNRRLDFFASHLNLAVDSYGAVIFKNGRAVGRRK